MSSFTCINLAAPQKLRELSDKDFMDALYIINDDNILDDNLKNYIYYDAKVTKVSNIMMETLLVNTNINDANSSMAGGSLDDVKKNKEEGEVMSSVLDNIQLIDKPNLLMLPSNPLQIIFDKILLSIGVANYYDNYFKLAKGKVELQTFVNKFVDTHAFYKNDEIQTINVRSLKKIIKNYTDLGLDLYAPMGGEAGKDRIIYEAKKCYSVRRYIDDYAQKIDEEGDLVFKKNGDPLMAPIYRFDKIKEPLPDNKLFNIICDPKFVLFTILKTKLGSNEKKATIYKDKIRFFTAKNGSMPFCCNGGCYMIARNSTRLAGNYPEFISIRQACNKCDKMRTQFDPLEIYDYGFRTHIIENKIVFINCRPSILKKKYCQNAGINQRAKLINDELNNDIDKIKEFNKKLELRSGKDKPIFEQLAGKEQQCPLNLIGPFIKEGPDIKKEDKDMIGLSTIYTHLVSNCYDQDHISGEHTDNKASNIWTLCKICHSQKTLLGGDFGSKKDGVIDKSKVDALNKAYKAYLDNNKNLIEVQVVAPAIPAVIPATEEVKDEEKKDDPEDDPEDEPEVVVAKPNVKKTNAKSKKTKAKSKKLTKEDYGKIAEEYLKKLKVIKTKLKETYKADRKSDLSPYLNDMYALYMDALSLDEMPEGFSKGLKALNIYEKIKNEIFEYYKNKSEGSGLKKSIKGGAKYSIDDIKNEINDNAKMFFFLVKNKKATLIAKGNDEEEAMSALSEKIATKPEKYIGEELMSLEIMLKNKGEMMSHGLIMVQVKNYDVKSAKKIKLNLIDEKHGNVWFTEKWLMYNGWDKKYLTEIVKKVVDGKAKLKAIAPNMYEMHIA